MRKKGFTYIEIMIAISIFVTMMLFLMKLDTVASRNIREFNKKVKMMYVAQGRMETFKSYPAADSSGVDAESGYYIIISSSNFSSMVREVTVTVKESASSPASDAVVLKSHLLVN